MAKKSNDIAKQLRKEYEKVVSEIKILLLGTGNSGKSTILKQFDLIHNQSISFGESVESEHSVISENIMVGMIALVEECQNLAMSRILENPFDNEIMELITHIKDLRRIAAEKSHDPGNPGSIDVWEKINFKEKEERICDFLLDVWKDPCVQEVYVNYMSKVSTLEVQLSYFFNEANYSRICSADYKPSKEDILYSRKRTTGLVTINFEIDGFKCKLFDVGGQRNERKKWISHFDNVDVVIFLVSLTDYCRGLLEDAESNRLEEAISVFKDIIEGPFFENNNFILFLNKKDLFESLVTKEPIAKYFPEFSGPNDYEAGIAFITEKFSSQFTAIREAQGIPRSVSDLFVYQTTATNTENVQVVFGLCKHILLMKNLASIGMF